MSDTYKIFGRTPAEIQQLIAQDESRKNFCPDCHDLVSVHENTGCERLQNTGLTQRVCPCTRTYESLVGEKQSALDIELCPCQNWASTDLAYLQGRRGSRHHPNCNGRGKWKPVPTGGTVAEAMERERKKQMETETSLQLLVIDMGESCVVKVEKGEWHRDAVCKYQGSTTITLPLARLREELDGDRPVPRIERNGGHFLIVRGGQRSLTALEFDALTEINGGVPLKVYKPTGKWEQLGRQVRGVINGGEPFDLSDELPVNIWRYTR